MAQKYIGITVGPIFDTLNLTSSPAALWAASYMFSSLTRNICESLVSEGVAETDIISPYYSSDCELLKRKNGVGLFHDRIIFRKGGFDFSKMAEMRKKAIENTAKAFGLGDRLEYLNEYIMVSSVEFEADNPILESAQFLDCVELAKPFVFKETFNPILALFTNDGSESKNEAIKRIVKDFGDDFQLFKETNGENIIFKSLSDIIKTGKGYKKYKYYAIVRSDGDNMSKIISSLGSDAEINGFSKNCLEYCADIANAVVQYNGVAIYSGGDDLLAILPCEIRDAKTPFEFIAEANKIFKNAFDKYGKETSLSFGVTVAYYKFPLYEALEDSANLLFGIAKQTKNCSVVRIQKHSGQSACLKISNDALGEVCSLLKKIASDNDEILLSAMHKLSLFENSFSAANDKQTVKNLFVNTFDASAHTDNAFVHEVLPEIFYSLKQGLGIFAIDGNSVFENDVVVTMHNMLRLLKFFIEKDGGNE